MRMLKGRSIINVLSFLFWVAILIYSVKGLTLLGDFSMETLFLPSRNMLVPLGLSDTEAVGHHWSVWLLSLDNPRFLMPELSILTPLKPFG